MELNKYWDKKIILEKTSGIDGKMLKKQKEAEMFVNSSKAIENLKYIWEIELNVVLGVIKFKNIFPFEKSALAASIYMKKKWKTYITKI